MLSFFNGSGLRTINSNSNRIVSLQCDMEVSKLRASMGDSIKLYSARAKAQAALGPQEVDVTKPAIDFSLRADSLFFSAAGTRMAMNVAGIKMKADKLNDSLWMPKGIVGFNRLRFRTRNSACLFACQKQQ